jgi:hypothetical protein
VALAKKLHRLDPKTGKRMSLRKISAALADVGHFNERGRPFNQRSNGLDYEHSARRPMRLGL